MKSEEKSSKPSEQEIIATFQSLRNENMNIASKLDDIEQDEKEHT